MSLANSPEFKLELKLSPGEAVVWDNARVMHGRTAYRGRRWLQGAYIDWDAVRSTYDLWRDEQEQNEETTVTGQQQQQQQQQQCGQRANSSSSYHGMVSGCSSVGGGGSAAISLDVHALATEEVLAALRTQEEFSYGEGVDMLQHALQVADIARRKSRWGKHAQKKDEEGSSSSSSISISSSISSSSNNSRSHGTTNGSLSPKIRVEESDEAVLACLLHDVGNSPQARALEFSATGVEPVLMVSASDGSIGYTNHSAVGARFCRAMGFAEAVCGAVELHVPAKRALVT